MISIVIPTYNRVRYLPAIIDSYLMQEYVSEIIFVDDGSVPDTQAMLQELQTLDDRIRIVRHNQNRGLPAARNTGLAHSSGEYVMFGEDDQWFCEGHCSTLLSHLQEKQCDMIAGRRIRVPSLERPEIAKAEAYAQKCDAPLIDYFTLVGNFHRALQEDTLVPFLHACALIKREVFEHLRYDETSYRVTYFREETDFYLRAGAHGFTMAFCPHTKGYHISGYELHAQGKREGGCGPKASLKGKMWNQVNNAVFACKNKDILRVLSIDYRVFVLRFFWTGLTNTLARGR